MQLGSSDNVQILLECSIKLIKELQMLFQISNLSIYNGNIKDSEHQFFKLNFTFKLFHVSVAVAKIL